MGYNKINFESTLSKGKHPFIPISIKNKVYYLIIDTGAQDNFMDMYFLLDTFTNEDNLEFLHKGNINTAGSIVEDAKKVSLNFHILYEEEFTKNYKEFFTIIDLKKNCEILSNRLGHQVIGILGSNFLNKYNSIIDFSNYNISIL